MPFVPSPQGGANWYPPVGGYTPVRGSMGVPGTGMASLFPDMTNRFGPMGNMMMQSMGYFAAQAVGLNPMTMMHRDITPVESMYGRAYQKGFAPAFNKSAEDMIGRTLSNYYVGQQGGGTLSAQMQARVDSQAKSLAAKGMTAVRLAPMLGINAGDVLKDIPGVSLYQGIANMRGGSLLPGAMEQRIHQNLMGSATGPRTYFGGAGGGPLSAGERGQLLDALGNRGLVGSPGALSGAAGSPKTQAAVRKLEGTVREWEGVVTQLKGIFGAGNSIDQLLSSMDRALGGNMAGMGAKRVAKLGASIQATMLANRLPASYVTETMAQSALAGQAMGISGGEYAGIEGINIGEAMVTNRGGRYSFGQRTAETISGLMTRRILGGRTSRLSMIGGGALELMRIKAQSLGARTEGMTSVQIARAAGASEGLVSALANLKSGKDPAAALAYFSESNSARIAQDLERSGITTRGAALAQFQTLTPGSQEMGLLGISASTLLGAQEHETTKRVTALHARRAFEGSGLSKNDITGKIADIMRKATSGKVDMMDTRKAIAAIASAGNISHERATTVYQTMKQEAGSFIAFEALYGGAAARATAAKRGAGAMAYANAGDKIRAAMGSDSWKARLIEEATNPESRSAKRSIANILGGKADAVDQLFNMQSADIKAGTVNINSMGNGSASATTTRHVENVKDRQTGEHVGSGDSVVVGLHYGG